MAAPGHADMSHVIGHANVSHATQGGTGSEPGFADRALSRGRSTHVIVIGKIDC